MPLDDDIAKLLASFEGAAISDKGQGEDERITKDPLTQSGVCLGMTTLWVRKKATGGGFWNYFATSEGLAEVKATMGRQVTLNTKIAAGKDDAWGPWRDLPKTEIESGHLRHQQRKVVFDMQKVYAFTASRLGLFHLTFMPKATDGGAGHTMAMWKKDDTMFVMDPNFGEFLFADVASACRFVDALLSSVDGYKGCFAGIAVDHFAPGAAPGGKPTTSAAVKAGAAAASDPNVKK